MTSTLSPAETPSATPTPAPVRRGPVGRLGLWSNDHRRIIYALWAVLVVALGILAPRVEHALSGAGWEVTGSESVKARDLIDREFDGLSSSALQLVVVADADATAADRSKAIDSAARALSDEKAVGKVVRPQPGVSISPDQRTAVVQGAADGSPAEMVHAAGRINDELEADGLTDADAPVRVLVTGSSGMWADFNEANRAAMMKSEVISWPVTLAIMVIAFGSLVAAGLPLALTIVGLVAAAGSLVIGAQFADISIWAMNFAMMFALALGIDYALFIVHRFRGALLGSGLTPREAVGVTMDTAGKAVVFSAATVLVSLSAVMLVPSPAFRSMSLGIMLAVVFVLAATITLLPALLGHLGPRVDRVAVPWHNAGIHRSPRFARWGARIGRRPIIATVAPLILLGLLAWPVTRLETGMPSIKVVPEKAASRVGYDAVQSAFGPGAPGALQVVVPAEDAERAAEAIRTASGVQAVTPPARSADDSHALIGVIPEAAPSTKAIGTTIDRVRDASPPSALVGGAAVEQHDLEQALSDRTVLVLATVTGLGFLLLLVAFQAPLLALVGAATNLLASAAAFGVAVWLFQDGRLVERIGIEPQGYLDAWAPVFFFAMVFAISMDYTVFLLASAKEHRDSGETAAESAIGGLAHSGRVILAAAAVMVAVFFTFALQGPLPPREMGIILGVAVLLDALLIRLVMLPGVMMLLGERAWACPSWLRRILPNIRFDH